MKPHLVEAFIRALKEAIESEGMSGLADRVGISKTTISNWVNRGSVPTLEAAGLVAKAIGFDLGKHNR